MPRVSLTKEQKKDHKLQDLAGWIAQKMFLKGLKQEDLGSILKISQPAVHERLEKSKEKGKDIFKAGELMLLFKELDATDEEILRLMKL